MSEQRRQRAEEIARLYHDRTGLEGPGPDTPLVEGDAVIAGADDRKDLFELDPGVLAEQLRRSLAGSAVILTDRSDLDEQADGSFVLDVDPFRRSLVRGGPLKPPCSGERFANQHTGGWCSGFLVGPDLIVTAGHCSKTQAQVKATAFVFGFSVGGADDPGTTRFSADQVYFGTELVAQDLSDAGDWAVVRVDREVTAPGAEPLLIRRSGEVGIGTRIGVIGHPSGLPVKVAFGNDTVVMNEVGPWLVANLDTYGGNSGSAVLDHDGLVEGILVRGARDYVSGPNNDCFRSNRVSNVAGSEVVTRAGVFAQHVPEPED